MININGVHFSYGKHKVLNNVSFSIEKGEFVCVLGANGSGKTTLLKTILAFLRPQQGAVTLYGQNVHDIGEKELAKKIAYIPQVHTPPFPFKVKDVVLLGRTPHLSYTCRPTAKDERVARDAMDRLGIGTLAEKRYTELSGGQRQMIIIARALTQQPEILIMDEPTTSLDFGNQYIVLAQMLELAREGISVLMVTHDPDHAIYCADRIIAMKSGSILAAGDTRDVINEPVMRRIYNMTIKVRDVSIDRHSRATICIPVPDIIADSAACDAG
ncbi:MAG: ABC transporter ATP-binding protein [Oscillospiraceae bacterium]|jgi:iron complex transport system ATP-binding protein|nr:ABC transporter ATP-binding protein [Oscillospiraceae bacterium]